jgi:type I restriction enzyme S subunit
LSRNAAYLKAMIVPDTKTLNAFEEVVAPIFSQLRVMREKNSNLGSTRDLLLPKLISGEIEAVM